MKKEVKKSTDKIKKELENIEEVTDAKKAKTYGDPIVELY